MRITRTLAVAVAIAVAALAAPAAQAGPADPPDIHASVALAAAQDLGPVRDADRAPAQPTVPEATAPVLTQAPTAERSGVGWTIIGLGLLAGLLAVAAVNNRRTPRVHVGV
jgi:hypothetical protein